MSGEQPHSQNDARVKHCLGAGGSQALATFLASPNAARLQKLDITHCRMGDDGLITLAEALRAPAAPELLDLDIRCNGITTRGITALISALDTRGDPDKAADARIWAAHPFSDIGDEKRRIESLGFRRPLTVRARMDPWCAWSSEEESAAMRAKCSAYAAAALALFPPKGTPPLGDKENKHSSWRMPQ